MYCISFYFDLAKMVRRKSNLEGPCRREICR